MDLDKINDLISQQDFEGAKDELETFLLTEPQNIEALKLLGLCNVNLGLFEQGKINFETVVKYKNDDALSWFYLASCYDNLEDFIRAKSAYQEVISLRENYLDAYKNLCIVFMKLKEEEAAIELGQKALELFKEDYTLYYLVGTALLSQKKFAQSIPFFEEALKLNPEHSQLYNNIGTAYLSTGDYQKAVDSYKQASVFDPRNSITYYNIGSILQIQNRHKEACEYFQKAYSLDKSEHYLVSLALSQFKSEQYDEAIANYKILVSQHPEKHNFQYNLACCYEAKGEYNFAIGILSQLVLLNPKSTMMSQKLANLFIITNQPLKAKEIYENIINKGLVSAEVYYEYAIICASTNDTDTAETILKKVVELNPEYAAAHKDLGVIYLTKRLFDYARDEFEQAYKIEPDNIDIIYEYANFLHAIGEFKNAEEFYAKALSKAPMNPNVLTFAALNSIAMEELENALEYVNSALKVVPEDDFILFCAGKINYLLKNFEEAQLYLIKSYEKNPTTEVINLLGLNYFELKEYEKACNIFGKLLQDNPENINLMLNSAKCFEALGNVVKAKENLNKILEIFPEFEEALCLLEKIS